MMKMSISKKEFSKEMFNAIIKKQFSSFVFDNPYSKFSSFKFYKREGFLNVVLNFSEFRNLRIRTYIGYKDPICSMVIPKRIGLWADDLFWRLQNEVYIQEDYSYGWSQKSEYYTIMDKQRFENQNKNVSEERKEDLEDDERFFD